MATSAAAQLLDELMGRYRNFLPTDRDKRISWESNEVCRHFLVKFCPHDLFTNTKSDLGPCEKIHDEEIRKEFEASNTHRRAAYEDEFVRYAESMLTDVDRRIEKGRQRLALSVQEALANSSTGDGRVDEQIQLLSEKITGLVNEAERLGSEGNVEDAQGLSKLCDQLREERDALRRANENSVWHQAAEMAASQEKQMEVCEICGAFLIVGDAQQRIDDHLTGKQHVGFAKLREAITEIRALREEREKQREKERDERKKALDDEDRRRDDRRKGYDREDRRDRHSDHKDYRHSRDSERDGRGGRDYNRRDRDRNRGRRDSYQPSRDKERDRRDRRRDSREIEHHRSRVERDYGHHSRHRERSSSQ